MTLGRCVITLPNPPPGLYVLLREPTRLLADEKYDDIRDVRWLSQPTEGRPVRSFLSPRDDHSSWQYRATALVNCVAPIFIHFALLLRNAVSKLESSSALSGGFALKSPVSASHSVL